MNRYYAKQTGVEFPGQHDTGRKMFTVMDRASKLPAVMNTGSPAPANLDRGRAVNLAYDLNNDEINGVRDRLRANGIL